MTKVELLAPAGNLEKLKIAFMYGADAVFIGGVQYGLRSGSKNFTLEDMKEAVKIAKIYHGKIYVTTNIYAHDENMQGFKEFVMSLSDMGINGIIVSDPYFIEIAKKHAPKLEIHISTQQSITNSEAIKFYEKAGASRVVLARELDMQQIKAITARSNIGIEIFLHGAVCSSYSGRCTLSNHMTSRDSNRGGCAQSCRWDYPFTLPNQNNTYQQINLPPFLMSAKDANLLPVIDQVLESGVDSLKIEGRMKSHHYIATVVNVYRIAIDAYLENPTKFEVKQAWIDELAKAESRPTSIGAYGKILGPSGQIYAEQYQEKNWEYGGRVLDYDEQKKIATIQQRNHFAVGDTVEIFGPRCGPYSFTVEKMYDEDDVLIEKANTPLMIVKIPLEFVVEADYMLRILRHKEK